MFKVFPGEITKDGQKIPLIRGWRDAATSDVNQIKTWQIQFGDRIKYWGVPTGKANGILALDVDTKTNGSKTIEDLKLFIPDTLSQRTLNGGTHFLFKHDPNKDPGNKVGFLPGLDIRSEGGYIFWYGKEVDWSKHILDAPDWIYTIAKARPSKDPIKITQSNVLLSPQIAATTIEKCLLNVQNAAAGESNDTLNRESFAMGQLVASGNVTKEYAATALYNAAIARGKPPYEAKATIESGLSGGIGKPLVSPFPDIAPVSFTLPVAFQQERWTPAKLTKTDLLNRSMLRKPQLFRDWSTEDISITTADGGTGKTTLMLHAAVCLALGDRFLGFDCLMTGKTLYITGEDTQGKLAAMIGQILNQMDILDDEAKVQTVLDSIIIKKDADLCLITKDKLGFLQPNLLAMDKILQAVDDIKPKMIIFDPIASFWGSESALNDMNKAVTKFMSALVERGHCNVEMINHMGKSSSKEKDMTQFAGRGGSGLPSNSRVSRVLHSIDSEEFTKLTGGELLPNQSAMICNVNKFSDGSPLLNQKFVILRDGFLFSRIVLSPAKLVELEQKESDLERVLDFIRQERGKAKFPTSDICIAHFMASGDPLSRERIKRALTNLQYTGLAGEKLKQIDNPDLTIKAKALIITDQQGNET